MTDDDARPRQLGGLVYRTGDDDGSARLVFIPADTALQVACLSAVTPVSGLDPPAVGIGLADGEVVTVLRLAPAAFSPADDDTGPGDPIWADWPLPGSDRAVIC